MIEILEKLGSRRLVTDGKNNWYQRRCNGCKKFFDYVPEQYSMGIFAGFYCDGPCWDNAPFRKGGKELFDPAYAGENYDEMT